MRGRGVRVQARRGGKAAEHPIARFRRWFADAQETGAPQPEAVALATATRSGKPSVRMVLLKQVDEHGFVFFTDARSRKGTELRANRRAALAFHWSALGRQVRVEGRVVQVTPAEADAYWRSRPRESQLAASSSYQSARIASRASLIKRWRELAAEYKGREVPRPLTWTGFRIVPSRIEFWTHREHRLHDRELFQRPRGGRWSRSRLSP